MPGTRTGSHVEMEDECLLSSRFWDTLNSNLFITTVGGIYLLDIKQLTNLKSETLETARQLLTSVSPG